MFCYSGRYPEKQKSQIEKNCQDYSWNSLQEELQDLVQKGDWALKPEDRRILFIQCDQGKDRAEWKEKVVISIGINLGSTVCRDVLLQIMLAGGVCHVAQRGTQHGGVLCPMNSREHLKFTFGLPNTYSVSRARSHHSQNLSPQREDGMKMLPSSSFAFR